MPNSWVQDIVQAMTNLGGSARYKDLYDEVYRIRGGQVPKSFVNVVRRTIQNHSSDSDGFRGVNLFYSVEGIGEGHWGLREQIRHTSTTIDLADPDEQDDEERPQRRLTETYRILRDTSLARTLKEIHDYSCQICGETLELRDGTRYSEAHHIKPLGRPHYGPDVEGNILVLCPNHHALCDLQAIELNIKRLRLNREHRVDEQFVDYHNSLLWGGERPN